MRLWGSAGVPNLNVQTSYVISCYSGWVLVCDSCRPCGHAKWSDLIWQACSGWALTCQATQTIPLHVTSISP